MSDVRIVEEDLRYKFYHGDTFALAYNKGHLGWGDFRMSRPNFYPVLTPAGHQVTTSSAYRYNHHKSVFLGHANVNGVNFFHDNNPTRDNLGDIRLDEADVCTTEGAVSICSQNTWVTKDGVELLTERRDVTWRPDDVAHVLDVSSAVTSRVGDVTFGKDTHSYFGVRVADSMDVEDGGRVINSHGHRDEAEAMGQHAEWVDYSGLVAGEPVGVTLIPHADNPPSPFFVRNYGTMLSNFTLHEPYTLSDGDTLTQRFRLVIHDGWGEDLDIDAYHAEFVL
jgi:hypothetical protein